MFAKMILFTVYEALNPVVTTHLPTLNTSWNCHWELSETTDALEDASCNYFPFFLMHQNLRSSFDAVVQQRHWPLSC